MITVKKISVNELPVLIRTSYEGDKDILATQHVMPLEDINIAVDITYGMVKQMAAEKKITHYKVIYKKKAIGYFCTFDKFLFSFGINIKFRKKEVLVAWWQQVVKSLEKNFLCILYPHQIRAIEFLKRNGMIVLEVDQRNNSIILIHKT